MFPSRTSGGWFFLGITERTSGIQIVVADKMVELWGNLSPFKQIKQEIPQR